MPAHSPVFTYTHKPGNKTSFLNYAEACHLSRVSGRFYNEASCSGLQIFPSPYIIEVIPILHPINIHCCKRGGKIERSPSQDADGTKQEPHQGSLQRSISQVQRNKFKWSSVRLWLAFALMNYAWLSTVPNRNKLQRVSLEHFNYCSLAYSLFATLNFHCKKTPCHGCYQQWCHPHGAC